MKTEHKIVLAFLLFFSIFLIFALSSKLRKDLNINEDKQYQQELLTNEIIALQEDIESFQEQITDLDARVKTLEFEFTLVLEQNRSLREVCNLLLKEEKK